MLNVYFLSILVFLTNVIYCQIDQTAYADNYVVYRADDENKNYDIWLNKEHYLPRDGKSQDIPETDTVLRVYVKFKSRFDGYRYRILCPNQWYWPEDTNKGNTFYVALYGAKERYQQEPPMEYVDPSKICLYQSLINPDDEKIVESRNPQSPKGPQKKMCCTDQPLTNYPGSDLAAVKLKPDAEFGDHFDESLCYKLPPPNVEGGSVTTKSEKEQTPEINFNDVTLSTDLEDIAKSEKGQAPATVFDDVAPTPAEGSSGEGASGEGSLDEYDYKRKLKIRKARSVRNRIRKSRTVVT